MPALDITQQVRSAIERNKGIPAMLDAYSEFLESPIGPLELQDLGAVFARILDNLSQRYPEIAAKRAATNSQSDVLSFLASVNNDADRLKSVLRTALASVSPLMVQSIAERFTRMNSEERRAVDATLRLIRRSPVEILFRAEAGKQLATSGREFERFFSSVKAESPTIRELRFENLIVEKAIFDKLLLRSKDRDYSIWVPSYFARENSSALIEKLSIPNEHLLLSRIRELAQQSSLNSETVAFLEELTRSAGLVAKSDNVPPEISDFFSPVGQYLVLPPIDLDDVYSYFAEEQAKREKLRFEEEEKSRREDEARTQEAAKKLEQQRQRFRPSSFVSQPQVAQQLKGGPGARASVYIGKQVDFDQLVSAVNRRVQERDFASQVKQIGDWILDLSDFKKSVAIVGSSGSGRSSTLKRLLDGVGQKAIGGSPQIIIIDQKGEHRGLAWKYGWAVYAFIGDSQAKEFRIPLFPKNQPEFSAELIQEWSNQSGFNCTDQQKERIAATIRSQPQMKEARSIGDLLSSEPETAELGQRLRKNLFSKSSFSKIFSETSAAIEFNPAQSVIFDISGRGLKDPTTKEERQVLSALLLNELASRGDLKNSIIVIEDTLDRFKSEGLKSDCATYLQKLRSGGNAAYATSRSNVREFLGPDCVEIVHRLSGEKVINEEFSQFSSTVPVQTLIRIIQFLPRGYTITSRYKDSSGNSVPTAAVRIEPLQFSATS